jgi:4-amino-4-deoxy-L-arabinose transferase-like glycosyltransferase
MANGLAARNGGRAGLAILLAILLLGAGLRVGEAWDGRAPVYDARAYAAIAANLERDEGFTAGRAATQPSSNYSPGLPLLVGGTYELSGGVHERFARVLLALIGSLAVLFTYLIARRLSGPDAGLIGAGVIAIYPALLEYQGMLMSEPLAATLLSASVLAILWAADLSRSRCGLSNGEREERGSENGPSLARPRDPLSLRYPFAAWLLPGVLLGALALVRPEYLGVALLLGIVVLASRLRGDRRAALAQAAILFAGVAVVVVPWTVRNVVALDRLVPISTGGGQVLFAGTYLPSDGNPERAGAEVVFRHPGIFDPADAQRLRLEQILARLAANRYPDLESDQALSRMGREQLWDDISEEPLEYAAFVATKVGRIWSHGPRDVMREPVWEALHWALVSFGLLGLAVLAWRRRWEALVLATVFLGITVLSALLVASPRRLLVMLPLVAALAGVGATFTASPLCGRRRTQDLGPYEGQNPGLANASPDSPSPGRT